MEMRAPVQNMSEVSRRTVVIKQPCGRSRLANNAIGVEVMSVQGFTRVSERYSLTNGRSTLQGLRKILQLEYHRAVKKIGAAKAIQSRCKTCMAM